ncbi:hypothetical protein BDY19DRAFT_956916 [Irpex rosettiformis]|uniref:Uncharacterized protein n=1 Tax=Irpex rosettiformis TaxID=378272 RepID=A0ACB8TZ11_9APHY|nr:hypothetical protein BDY19DRAFT_956916 [Irpex rosettiformis]
MRNMTLSLAVALTCALTALGNIYGTSPIANTVWTAGRSETVEWIDDKTSPRLSRLGPVDVELYSSDDNLVATLAQGIDAEDKSFSAWISPSWGYDGSDYYIMFSCKKPPVTIFTASFTIVGMAYMSSSGDNTTAWSPDSDGFDPDSLGPNSPNTTATSTHSVSAVHSTGLSVSASATSSAQPSSTLPPISPQDEEDYLRNHRGPGAVSNGGTTLNIDYERLKFQLVFIIWPAIIGITMAL